MMTETAREIVLISFSSVAESASFQEVLAGAGYAVHAMTSRQCSDAGIDGPNAVLFLGRAAVPRDSFEAVLRSLSRPPILCVIDRQAAEWDPGLLGRCTDFLSWPCPSQEVTLRLERTIGRPGDGCAEQGLLARFERLNLIGRAPVFMNVLRLVEQIADCEAPTLIEGETGTGKEVVARALHYLSERRSRPFIPVNCGAIPDNLLENELFGHDKGAFTDACTSHPGLVEQATHGTLFLDEVEALTPKGQVVLLRFLQDRKYRSLGGKRLVEADLRVITASNTDLRTAVAAGDFRQDLYFRLNVLSVSLPSLRDRDGDVERLAEHFVQTFCAKYDRPIKVLHPSSLIRIRTYDWPGNVRELENVIHRGVLLSDGSPVLVLPPPHHPTRWGQDEGERQGRLSFREAKERLIADFEKSYVSSLLAEACGNVTLAAERAGKERRAFGKLLKKYGIDRADYTVCSGTGHPKGALAGPKGREARCRRASSQGLP